MEINEQDASRTWKDPSDRRSRISWSVKRISCKLAKMTCVKGSTICIAFHQAGFAVRGTTRSDAKAKAWAAKHPDIPVEWAIVPEGGVEGAYDEVGLLSSFPEDCSLVAGGQRLYWLHSRCDAGSLLLKGEHLFTLRWNLKLWAGLH